jgi:hypothetical protein
MIIDWKLKGDYLFVMNRTILINKLDKIKSKKIFQNWTIVVLKNKINLI